MPRKKNETKVEDIREVPKGTLKAWASSGNLPKKLQKASKKELRRREEEKKAAK